jgi:hypothetical protein
MDEQEIKAVAPSITPADIEANIVSEFYYTAWQGAQRAFWDAAPTDCNDAALDQYALGEPRKDGPLGRITHCTIILRNGFTVTGVNEGPVSPENFDADKGRKYARENAIEQIWLLMGYELKCRLAREAADIDEETRL